MIFKKIASSILALGLMASLATSHTVSAEEKDSEETMAPEKIVVIFQKQKNPKELQAAADKVSAALEEKIGIPVDIVIPSSYGASVQALVSETAHVAYLSSIPYLLAKNEAPVEIILAEERDGRTDYDSVFVVKKDSPYQSLEELKGKRMMFTSPTSTSGYVMAYSRLVNDGFLEPGENPDQFFSEVNFAGGYDKALLAVLYGQADLCAVSDYTMEGEKAKVYLPDDKRSELRVLTETPGVPTHLIAVRSDLPQEIKSQIKEAILSISENSPELLSDVYGAAKFVEVDEEEHIKGAAQAIRNTKLGVKGLVK